ncbi:hypothetical protein HZB00_00570 [Candidatus Woesearchaeota archaeon]|nr:hypothetical protein [Candidatus Woesearchaeota archaeon]
MVSQLNLQEPTDTIYRKRIEDKIIFYWTNKTPLKLQQSHPKLVTYIKNTEHLTLQEFYYGCAMIEFKNNLFSEIFKNFLKLITYSLPLISQHEIIPFMRGILAAEGTIAHHPSTKHYGVHISAIQETERIIYREALAKIGISAKIYLNYKEILISQRSNLVQLLNQRLMTLHPRKYNKFLYMMQQYPSISEETTYFRNEKRVWNKISDEKIKQILALYQSGIIKTKEIAEKLQISQIKVQRVLRQYNLGKRVVKVSEDKRKEITQFCIDHPKLTQKDIAKHFNVSQIAVSRALRKYQLNLQ